MDDVHLLLESDLNLPEFVYVKLVLVSEGREGIVGELVLGLHVVRLALQLVVEGSLHVIDAVI